MRGDYLSSALLVTRYLVTERILPQRKSFSPRPGRPGGKFLRFGSESLRCSHHLAALAQKRRNIQIVLLEVRDHRSPHGIQ